MHYVHADQPGISRKALKRGWAYYDEHGNRITEREEIDRLNAIALPPAYRDAWFSPSPDAHLLATGRDARGRKQYRYHPQYRSRKERQKYANCLCFGQALPALRKRVAKDLRQRKLTMERAVAALVRLLDCGHIRIGNEHYAKSNGSYGACTLLMRHVDHRGAGLRIRYRGKGGKEQELEIDDRSLARFVRDMQDLPGQRLFQFLDPDGNLQTVGSADVNDYIRAAMGDAFTAKDFRTWGASVAAFEALVDTDGELSPQAIAEIVAGCLGNTPIIARKSYIHPKLLEFAGKPPTASRKRKLRLLRATRWLSPAERGLLKFLS